MILPFMLAALVFAALLPVLLPLLGRTRAGQGDYSGAVYRDQLRELERDIERGLLRPSEAGQARLEIQRRLLAVAPEPAPMRSGSARGVAALTGIIASLGAIGVYLMIGVPVTPRSVQGDLTERLRADPSDTAAWILYAGIMTEQARWPDAEAAWRRVTALAPSAASLAALGEVVTMRGNGAVSPDARGLFEMALAADPGNDMARYYLATAAAQGGDTKGAVEAWLSLLEDMAPDAAGRAEVLRRIDTVARAAGMPVPSLEARIDALAARLHQFPEDASGWKRLGRASAGLGRNAAAADAYEAAAALDPDDPALKLAAAEALLTGLKPADAIPPRAIALLHEVESAAPDAPAVLWYLGLAAARERRTDEARAYWTRLRALLPPDQADGKMVRAALNALAGKP